MRQPSGTSACGPVRLAHPHPGTRRDTAHGPHAARFGGHHPNRKKQSLTEITQVADDTPDPRDAEIEQRIVSYDPIRDLEGPIKGDIEGIIKQPETLSVKMFAPEVRDRITAAVGDLPPEAAQRRTQELIQAELERNKLAFCVLAGPGETANAYVREQFEIERQKYDMQGEVWRLETELAAIGGWETFTDPDDGSEKPRAVPQVQGERRRAMEARRDELLRQQRVLETIDGPKRLRAALTEARENEKRLLDEVALQREVDVRAKAMLREERVKELATNRAKTLRGKTFGV